MGILYTNTNPSKTYLMNNLNLLSLITISLNFVNSQTPLNCTFSDCLYPEAILSEYACGKNMHIRMDKAEAECCSCSDCTGITRKRLCTGYVYSARKGELVEGAVNEDTYLRTLITVAPTSTVPVTTVPVTTVPATTVPATTVQATTVPATTVP